MRTPKAEVQLGGDHYVGRGAPLRSAGGDALGGFIALRSREAEMAPFVALRRWIAVAGLLGLVVAFGLSYLAARSVARPVLALAEATRRAADGDYSAAVDVESDDEVGELANAVRTMLVDLREKEALVAVMRTPPELPSAIVSEATPVGALTSGGGRSGTGGSSGFEMDAPEPIITGRLLARRYAIAEQLGIGGSGVVYRAFDRELGEVVAVKTLRPDVLAVDPTALERLKSEIRLARRISHRNVVRTHDLGEADGVYFITMEYVTGTSLRELVDRGSALPVHGGGGDREAAVPGARGGARAGRDPSRHQATEPDDAAGRDAQGDGLRRRASQGASEPPDEYGDGGGYAGVHGAGAADGRPGGRAGGHLRDGGGDLRVPNGSSSGRWQLAARAGGADDELVDPSASRGEPGGSQAALGDRHAGAGQGRKRAALDGGRAL